MSETIKAQDNCTPTPNEIPTVRLCSKLSGQTVLCWGQWFSFQSTVNSPPSMQELADWSLTQGIPKPTWQSRIQPTTRHSYEWKSLQQSVTSLTTQLTSIVTENQVMKETIHDLQSHTMRDNLFVCFVLFFFNFLLFAVLSQNVWSWIRIACLIDQKKTKGSQHLIFAAVLCALPWRWVSELLKWVWITNCSLHKL